MRGRITFMLAAFVLVALPNLTAFAQGSGGSISLDQTLPQDPAVRVGMLDNGMTYYIRQNDKPEDRAELRLAVRAGSINEDDDQRGLAHFVEHMAFNGSEHFEKNELVEFLESIGMRFGADLNAFTSFDQTVYMLQVPTDDETSLDKGLLILHDWAGGLSMEEDEIEAERGVIVEEWRSRRSGDSRINDQHFEVTYAGSQYAERMPIGKKEIIEGCPPDALRRFYNDWYRPGLQAIVAVGDFDPDEMEAKIREQFGDIPAQADPRPREQYDIPVHDGLRVSIGTDPEASNRAVGMTIKHERASRDKVRDYYNVLLDQLVTSVLNERLNELTRESDPPFVIARTQAGLALGNHRQFNLVARVKGTEYERALRATLTEVERLRRHGVTAAELERQQSAMLKGIEQYYQNRDKTESGSYAREYYSNFTSGESFPGIEYEYRMYNQFIPNITVEEANAAARRLIADDGRVITVSGTDEENGGVPSESAIRQVVKEVMQSDIAPKNEEAIASALMDEQPKAGSVVSEETIEDIGVTKWTLSNGATVLLKPTDFKNDEIHITGFSPGGTSLAEESDFIPASSATSVVNSGGVGGFDASSLEKFLAGKNASFSTNIGSLYETVSGQASNEDAETMFQLLYLRFTSPRKDAEAFESYRARMKGILESQGARPEQVFSDTVDYVMSGYHPRAKPWTTSTPDQFDLDKSFKFYEKRFSHAGDFTFVIVGSFEPGAIRPLVETYIASLPGNDGEQWRDVGMKTPEGEIKKVVRKGVESKGQVRIVYTGDFDWSMENRHKLQSLIEVLRMKLRETLREEKGGVYSPAAWGRYDHYPEEEYQINVFFGCDPERADELIGDVNSIINELKNDLVDQSYIDKVKEIQRRQRETSLKENGFWLNSLQFYLQHDEPLTNILEYGDLYMNLTPELIRNQARKLFGDNRMTFILRPEDA